MSSCYEREKLGRATKSCVREVVGIRQQACVRLKGRERQRVRKLCNFAGLARAAEEKDCFICALKLVARNVRSWNL